MRPACAGSIAAGEIVIVSGAGMAGESDTGRGRSRNGTDGTAIAQARVLFDGAAAPLFYVRRRNRARLFLRSRGKKRRSASRVSGREIGGVDADSLPGGPGLFSADSSGKGQAQANNQDGTPEFGGQSASRGDTLVLSERGRPD